MARMEPGVSLYSRKASGNVLEGMFFFFFFLHVERLSPKLTKVGRRSSAYVPLLLSPFCFRFFFFYRGGRGVTQCKDFSSISSYGATNQVSIPWY